MPAFTSTWDDFTGGYFVGENDNRQPRSTFTGENVAVSINDGSVVATNKVQQITIEDDDPELDAFTVEENSLYIDGGSGADVYVTPAVQADNYIFFAVRLSQTTFKMFRLSFSNFGNGTLKASAAVTIDASYKITNVFTTNEGGQIYAYIGNKTTLYRFTGDGDWDSGTPAVKTDIAVPVGIEGIEGITVWNARMVVWSLTTDSIYFSEALDFDNWPSINFLAPGYSNNGVICTIPRYDDLLVVKPNAIYSITGVLGATSVVRQISDAIYPSDNNYSPIVSQSNTMFYLSRLTDPYYSNINFLSGQQIGVAAYQNFGRAYTFQYDHVTKPSLAASSNGDVVCTYSAPEYGVGGFFALIRNRFGDWVKIKSPSFSFYAPAVSGVAQQPFFIRRYSAVNNYQTPSVSSPENGGISPNTVIFMQVASKTFTGSFRDFARYKSITFGYWNQQQVNAGSDYETDNETVFSTVTEGTLILSAIDDQKASKLRRIYVEAVLDMDYANYGDFTGSAQMKVSVINGAPEDVAYDPTLTFVSGERTYTQSLTSIPNTTTFTPTTANAAPYTAGNPYKRVTATRILRFDSDNMGYGYKHNISITFSGFRIKRVWVEGDTR
jgi:hypothetical protein